MDDADVYRLLISAPDCFATPRNRWRLEGLDARGDPLTAIVEIRARALVVTLFRGDE